MHGSESDIQYGGPSVENMQISTLVRRFILIFNFS